MKFSVDWFSKKKKKVSNKASKCLSLLGFTKDFEKWSKMLELGIFRQNFFETTCEKYFHIIDAAVNKE